MLGRLRLVVGLDPGESTGLLALKLVDDLRRVIIAGRYQGPPDEALACLRRALDDAREFDESVILAGERFTTTNKTAKRSAQPTPLKVLGAAELLAASYERVKFTLQSPADAKKLAPNDVLRDFGFYSRASDVGCRDANDVNDAARHALLALLRFRPSVFDDLLRRAETHNGDVSER